MSYSDLRNHGAAIEMAAITTHFSFALCNSDGHHSPNRDLAHQLSNSNFANPIFGLYSHQIIYDLATHEGGMADKFVAI